MGRGRVEGWKRCGGGWRVVRLVGVVVVKVEF